MKKEYVKPFLAVESFQLDAAIAGACSDEYKFPINHGADTCIIGDNDGGVTDVIFGAQCSEDAYNGNDYCYHNAVNAQYLTS